MKQSGFTLIETFVAVSILMVGVIGPLSIISRFFLENEYARQQITATYLGREGMDLALNYIKNNTEIRKSSPPVGFGASGNEPVEPTDWLVGLGDCRDSNRCNISAEANPRVTPCYGGYGDCSETINDTVYTREIKINELPDKVLDNGNVTLKLGEITVTVSWKTRLGITNKTYQIKNAIVQTQ